MERRLATSEEFFDLCATIKSTLFVNICYMTYARLNKTKSEINPETKKKRNVVDYDDIRTTLGDNNLVGIITVTNYTKHQWVSADKLKVDYATFRDKSNEIRREFGIEPMKKRKKPMSKMNYGNGVEVGNTKNTKGKTFVNQNTAKTRRKVRYFGVDINGNITREFSYRELSSFLQDPNRQISGVADLVKAARTEYEIARYIQKILDLGMEYTTFKGERVLYMVGSDAKGKFFYKNDKLSEEIEGIRVNPQQFLKFADEKFQADYGKLNEEFKSLLRKSKLND